MYMTHNLQTTLKNLKYLKFIKLKYIGTCYVYNIKDNLGEF